MALALSAVHVLHASFCAAMIPSLVVGIHPPLLGWEADRCPSSSGWSYFAVPCGFIPIRGEDSCMDFDHIGVELLLNLWAGRLVDSLVNCHQGARLFCGRNLVRNHYHAGAQCAALQRMASRIHGQNSLAGFP